MMYVQTYFMILFFMTVMCRIIFFRVCWNNLCCSFVLHHSGDGDVIHVHQVGAISLLIELSTKACRQTFTLSIAAMCLFICIYFIITDSDIILQWKAI